MKNKLEITKEQARLFLELIKITKSVPAEDNLLKVKYGDIEINILDLQLLTKTLKEFTDTLRRIK